MSDQDDLPPEYAEIPRGALKHGKGRYKDVILVPQPSDSPNDPLNWPQWCVAVAPVMLTELLVPPKATLIS